MIFISVLLPAPFSPTRPWISPALSVRSTPRRAWTPPKDFEMSTSSRSGGVSAIVVVPDPISDQELLFHPRHSRRVGLCHDRTLGDDALWGVGAGLGPGPYPRHARPHPRATDSARLGADG